MRRSIQLVTVAVTLLLIGCPKKDPPPQETKETKKESKSADDKASKTGDDDDDDDDPKPDPKGSSSKKSKKDDDDDEPAAPASAKPSVALTATPGVKYDPKGYPGGFAAECDHKLNGVSHQPEDYVNGGDCERKWAPSCEAVLKCTAGKSDFAP